MSLIGRAALLLAFAAALYAVGAALWSRRPGQHRFLISAERAVFCMTGVTTVAAVEQGLPEYDPEKIHHFVLTRAAAEDVFRTLATETIEQRRENPGMEAQRADVIVGGCCVLVAIMRRFGFDDCHVSEADILDGLVLSLL